MIKHRLNHRQIEAFYAMMLTGSVNDAAARIGVSQPAVSRLLKDLQHHLKLELFNKVGNRLQPTQAAYSLLVEVERSYSGLDRILEVADELRVQRTSLLRIAGMPALTNGLLPRLVGKFLADRPNVQVSVTGMLTTMVMEAVMNNQCDVGFIEGETPTHSLRVIEMPNVDRVAIFPKGHRFEALDTVHLHDLEGEDFIPIRRSKVAAGPVLTLLIRQAIHVKTRAESPLSEIVCPMVASGLGVSIIDPFTAEEYSSRGIGIRPLMPPVPFAFKAVTPLNDSSTGLALEFIELVRREVSERWVQS